MVTIDTEAKGAEPDLHLAEVEADVVQGHVSVHQRKQVHVWPMGSPGGDVSWSTKCRRVSGPIAC